MMRRTTRARRAPGVPWGLSRIGRALLTVTWRAGRLGLVAPFTLRAWDQWWAETDLGKTPARISLSRSLDTRRGREQIASNYGEPESRCSPEMLLAHELGHVFQDWWGGGRAPAPIRGYGEVFGSRARFRDPWNDLLEYLEEHPGFSHDPGRHISLYA